MNLYLNYERLVNLPSTTQIPDRSSSSAAFSLAVEVVSYTLSDPAFEEISIGLLIIGVYLFPFFVADKRNHHDRLSIFIFNITLGWTLIGYVVTLIWSLTPTRGFRTIANEFADKSAPILKSATQSAQELGKEAAAHPLARDIARSLQKATGGRLVNYKVPPEGVQHLILSRVATRDYEGRITIRSSTLLPPSTRLTMHLFDPEIRKLMYYSEIKTGHDGSLTVAGLLNAGKIFNAGEYVLRISTLPIELGVQADWIVDVLGEHGRKMPHSATLPVDGEFPNYGRRVEEVIDVQFPVVQYHMSTLEFLKNYTFQESARSRTVESAMRDHFSARLDEKSVLPNPWNCEEIGAGIWMVSFSFTRQGRINIARWEVDMQHSSVKFQDPDARLLSGVERRS